jgi:hypothetical protein
MFEIFVPSNWCAYGSSQIVKLLLCLIASFSIVFLLNYIQVMAAIESPGVLRQARASAGEEPQMPVRAGPRIVLEGK